MPTNERRAFDSILNAELSQKGETMTTRTKERAEFLSDVIITAIESGHDGVAYWADVKGYNNADESNVQATIVDRDAPERGEYVVTVDTIASGIRRILQDAKDGGDCCISDRRTELLKEADRENDGSNVDADIAELIVQAGTLGRIVYG